ncbi:hypothetical protein F5X99DRAFT_193951 [Biscogniauxia marginata]|nr:hypothetical protein F5X99DRAFT_193951 [Biscogniauxia marginata]
MGQKSWSFFFCSVFSLFLSWHEQGKWAPVFLEGSVCLLRPWIAFSWDVRGRGFRGLMDGRKDGRKEMGCDACIASFGNMGGNGGGGDPSCIAIRWLGCIIIRGGRENKICSIPGTRGLECGSCLEEGRGRGWELSVSGVSFFFSSLPLTPLLFIQSEKERVNGREEREEKNK